MKQLILVLAAALALLAYPAFGKGGGDVHVNGYFRSNGTYVAPHMRSTPDGNPYNNWTTRGNVNPYTDEVETKNVDGAVTGPVPSYRAPSTEMNVPNDLFHQRNAAYDRINSGDCTNARAIAYGSRDQALISEILSKCPY